MNHNSDAPVSGNTGYVYILANPSFKEDWVKIGKSSRPVDVRSMELDNTAVPLPFEINSHIPLRNLFRLVFLLLQNKVLA